MKKLVFVLLSVITFPTLIQPQSLYDIFPLAKWNKYTYNYIFTDSTYYVGSFESFQKDSGEIVYTIIDKINYTDRIEWIVEQQLDLVETYISPIIDTTFYIFKKNYFVLNEFLDNNHPLSASPQTWDTVNYWGVIGIWRFPVFGQNNTTITIDRYNSNPQVEIINNFPDFLDSLWFDVDRGLYKRIYKTRYLGNHQIYTRTEINLAGAIVDNDDFEFIKPSNFFLSQNYPNPFNPSTKISWQAPVSGWHTLKVYDVLGNEVATLVDEYKNAVSYEVEFKSIVGNRQFANGVYFYQLKAGDYLETKKMILLK